jgi:AraC-like DNA-binding protein
MLYLAGIFITFFLSVLLAGKKGKSAADKILTAWLTIIGFHLALFYLYVSGKYVKTPWLLGIETGLPLIHGPFLFLYTIALTQGRKIKLIGWLHFLPFIITNFLVIPFYLLPADTKIYVYQHEGAGYEELKLGILIAIIVSGITYVALSFWLLRKHRVNIEKQFSNTARINLNWLRYLIYGISAIWIVIITRLDDTYIFATVVLFVFFIGYFGIRQVGIFSNNAPVDLSLADNTNVQVGKVDVKTESLPVNVQSEPVTIASIETNEPAIKTKYQKSSLSEETAAKLHEQLTQLMVTEKLFTNPELNLTELAERLDVHPNILSQVINSFENKTFYDYINGLRIEEFKNLVADPRNQQYTFLSLAFDCGFNSKTAFNRNFKKSTGLSPSEYLNQLKISLA